MPYLQISITLPGETYHGQGDEGKPEWPPSPMRLFQALVATAARSEAGFSPEVVQSLDWWASLAAPIIVARRVTVGNPYTTSVPNNAMDIVASAWSRGNETGKDAQPATHRAMKTIRTMYFDEPGPVVYLWEVEPNPSAEVCRRIQCVIELAKRMFALGWGLDLATGHAVVVEQVAAIPGERWLPIRPERGGLRLPNEFTLNQLMHRHQGFMQRVARSRLNAIPNISPGAYRQILYQPEGRPPVPKVAVFQFLRTDDTDRFRSFPTLRACAVAGMLRHAAATAAGQSGWSQERINSFVLGHAEGRSEEHLPVGRSRFAYLPLPSLEYRGGTSRVVGRIRRALIFVPAEGAGEALVWASRALDGSELIAQGQQQAQAVVSLISERNRNVSPYLQADNVWESVTPVVLPGRDDRKQKKTERLIRKAIVQAGFSEMLATHAEIDWRSTCFWPGGEHANRYFLPDHLRNFPRCHCQIRWKDTQGNDLRFPGPLAIGGGKYAGLGLFASPLA